MGLKKNATNATTRGEKEGKMRPVRREHQRNCCHDPLPVGIFLAAEESQNSQEGEDTEELRSVK